MPLKTAGQAGGREDCYLGRKEGAARSLILLVAVQPQPLNILSKVHLYLPLAVSWARAP